MFTGLVQKVGVLRRLVRSGGGWTLVIAHGRGRMRSCPARVWLCRARV
jgi:hypothetical protein